MNMIESEIRTLLDAHDLMVKAYVDSSLGFDEFVSAYGDFPRNYGLVGASGPVAEQTVLRFFRERVAFHLRVAGILSGLRLADDPAGVSYGDANRFLPAVGRRRIRELVARYPDFEGRRRGT